MKALCNFSIRPLLYTFLMLWLGHLQADMDPLPSWNDSSAKKAILDFVSAVTQEGGLDYVAVQDRIATFDHDGTLWVEQPVYTQFLYALESVRSQAAKHPEWSVQEPFKTVLSGDLERIKSLDMHAIEPIMSAAFADMTLTQFHRMVAEWLAKAVHPRFKKPFTKLVYQPMLELMQLLKEHQFDVFIVSGGGQEFIRVFSEDTYGIAPSHVIGTAGKVKYDYREGHPVLIKLPEVLFVDDKGGKPAAINLFIGAQPVAAFGNSIGDQQMLEWSQARKGRTLQLLVHHDDAQREYAYGPDSKVGTFTAALMGEAKQQKWIVVSMKNDWKVIFAWQKALHAETNF